MTNAAAPGSSTIFCAALALPLLVLPTCSLSTPLCPFDVASTDAGTAAVFCVFVSDVVGKVTVDEGSDSEKASPVRNTSAKPGAGTSMEQVLAPWSQGTLTTFSAPRKRPSDWNVPLNVYENRLSQVGGSCAREQG